MTDLPILLQGLLFFGMALGLSLALTRLMISLAPRLGLMDSPGERRIHTTVIPRAGGIAIYLSLIVTLFVVTRATDLVGKLDNHWLLGFGWASLALVITGIIDDRWGMNAWIKLLMHALSAAILFFMKGETEGVILGMEVPWPVELAIWIAWTVAIINAFNLIDGMDGLCAGLGLISVASLTVLNIALGLPTDAIVLASMMGALFGFLRYNFHPARIFLGDTGSMLIGFFIASIALVSTGERFTLATLLLPLIVAGIPLIDVILAVWRRGFKKWLSALGVGDASSVFGADKDHLHHRLLSYGLTQRKVASLLYGLAVMASLLALVPYLFDDRTLGLTIAALFISALMGFRYLAPIELRISGEVLKLMIQKPRKGKISRFLLTAYDSAAILLGIFIAYFLESHGEFPTLVFAKYANNTVLPTTAVTLAVHLLFLNAARAYSRRWSRATLRDFFSLGVWFLVGAIVSATANIMINGYWYDTILIQTIGAGLTGALLVIPRATTPLIRESVIDSLHRNLSNPSGARPRVLLYGAGDHAELFLSHIKSTSEKHFAEKRIIGFLDDQVELTGRYFDGLKIFGGLDTLPALCERWDLDGLIITTASLTQDEENSLQILCKELNINLYSWTPCLDLSTRLAVR